MAEVTKIEKDELRRALAVRQTFAELTHEYGNDRVQCLTHGLKPFAMGVRGWIKAALARACAVELSSESPHVTAQPAQSRLQHGQAFTRRARGARRELGATLAQLFEFRLGCHDLQEERLARAMFRVRDWHFRIAVHGE